MWEIISNIFISQSGGCPIMVSLIYPQRHWSSLVGSTSSSEFHFPLAFDEKAAALAMRMLCGFKRISREIQE